MEIHLSKKFPGLIPPEEWKNPKGHLSALTKGGKVIAYGESNLGGVPRFCAHRGQSCHSEMEVLKYIQTEDKRKIRKYVMWNIRWTKNGDIVNSKPCIHCINTIKKTLKYKNYTLKKFWYTDESGNFIKLD